MNKPQDAVGKEINIGDWIVYGNRRGDVATIKVGRVVDFKKSERPFWYPATRPDPADAVMAKSAEGWSGGWKTQKRVKLPDPSKIIVVPESAIPENVRALVEACK